MSQSWRLLAEYDSETTAFTTCVGASAPSPYTPEAAGRLIGLRAVANRSSAASLINHCQFKLTCPTFRPTSSVEVGVQGSGLQTAPAIQAPAMDWACDLEVAPANPIKIEGRNITADTPVTVSVLLYGLFQG